MTPALASLNMAEFRHGVGEGQAMTNTDTDTLSARINVLSPGLQEIARALAPAQAGQVTEALRAETGAS